mgnify:CR=1 FL=1
MKIFTLSPNENWIVDRFVEEWNANNKDIIVDKPNDADIIWLAPAWAWRHVSLGMLTSKKVVATIHHIVPEKFKIDELNEFKVRDQFVTAYHVPCQKTADQIRQYTKKDIHVIPFWVNPSVWYHMPDRLAIRKKYGLDEAAFLIGSFQRDTEGSDLKTPKLEKGPDIFCDIVEKYKSNGADLTVVLAGWRRQYIMNRLDVAGIKYHYFEMADFATLNELYNALSLYIVSSRHEGGPQAVVECALTKTPIISTDVGIASQILSYKSIFDHSFRATPDIVHAYEAVQDFLMPKAMLPFRELFESL